KRLAAAVRKAGVRGQMFSQVNQPYERRAKRALRDGRIGELRAVHCDLHFAKGHAGSARLGQPRSESWPPRRFLYPDAKREMFNIAVYSVALIRWLSGREVRSVRAVTSNYFFAEHQQRGFEDFAMMTLALEGGITATVTAGRIGWSSHLGSGPNLTRLYGSAGSVLVDAFEPRFEAASDRAEWSPPARDPDDPMGFWRSTQVKGNFQPKPEWTVARTMAVRSDQSLFIDAIESGRDPEVTIEDGAKILEVLLAGYQSAATHHVVELPLTV
ncbi:MAG: Gfo/Idh/MocA family oxidoreductase, partial [bacterium]|nr:Gfo/Idh/MocA family oxidoreductase [bacterium]